MILECLAQSKISDWFYVALLAWEFWLGRTDKVKASSTIGLVINIFRRLFRRT